MPQQGLWPWPRPLAGKQAEGGGGVRAQASRHMLCAGAGRGLYTGAQAAQACLPHGVLGAWPTGLPRDGRHAWHGAGMVPCPVARVGSGSSWLMDAFEARYLIGPCRLAAIFLFRSVKEGSPCAHLGSSFLL